MVRVDAAPRAEVVLRRAGIEPVNSQRLLAGVERDAADLGRHGHRAAHSAIRTGASASAVETVRQFHSEAHGTAVAYRFHFPCFIRLHRQAPELCRRFHCDAFNIQRVSERFIMPQNTDHIRHSPDKLTVPYHTAQSRMAAKRCLMGRRCSRCQDTSNPSGAAAPEGDHRRPCELRYTELGIRIRCSPWPPK